MTGGCQESTDVDRLGLGEFFESVSDWLRFRDVQRDPGGKNKAAKDEMLRQLASASDLQCSSLVTFRYVAGQVQVGVSGREIDTEHCTMASRGSRLQHAVSDEGIASDVDQLTQLGRSFPF